MEEQIDQFTSCNSYWSTWDSLYTLSEEEDFSEGSTSIERRRNMLCTFCQENIDMSLTLSDKMDIMQKKLNCLFQIKSELTDQLRESNQMLKNLELENVDLRNQLKFDNHPKSSKSFLNNILKKPSKCISMPEKLDSIHIIDKKRTKSSSFIKALKRRKTSNKLTESKKKQIEEEHSAQDNHESIVSRW